jgi:hypothetical protein
VPGKPWFFVERGRIQGELMYEPVCFLEQSLFARGAAKGSAQLPALKIHSSLP